MIPAAPPICLLTGATGYLGSRVRAHLEQAGWRVVPLGRRPSETPGSIPFRLGEEIEPDRLAGAAALVHCAYDFQELVWGRILAVNVEGSAALLRAARNAGVERLVVVSSMSAFEGCRSLYGKAKLATERIALSMGALVIRPGLIFGEPPGGLFARMVTHVNKSHVVPVFGAGRQVQFLVHDHDLSELIHRFAAGQIASVVEPVTVAHERPWQFREILQEIARAAGRNVLLVPVPWRLAWLGLKAAESLGLRLGFRSDSLIGLAYANRNPSFAAARQLAIQCRPFRMTTPVAAER